MDRVRRYLISCFLGGLLFAGFSFINKGFVYPFPLEQLVIPVGTGAIVGAILASYLDTIQHHHRKSQTFFLNLIETLATTLDERDSYTHGHSRRVTQLSVMIGKSIGLKQDDINTLQLAGTLHDIGKIGISDEVLLKEGRLTTEEFTIIKEHPVKAEHILKTLGDPRMEDILKAVLHHHERFDGAGYPNGLSGENIPMLSRIISVADTYDAMTSTRPYRKELSKEIALNEIEANSNTQFDPMIATAFLNVMKHK